MSDKNTEGHMDDLDIGKRIAIEFGTELQLEIEGVVPRARTELVGMEPGKYFIVKTPSLSQLGGVSGKLFPGNRVLVRYVYRGSAYGFETTVMDAISTPVRLLFLTCPRVVVERNIRTNRRIDTVLPAKVTSGNQVVEGTVTDISVTGCHFRAKAAKGGTQASLLDDLNKEVSVSVQVPGVQGELTIAGKLKNVRKDHACAEAGIEFGELDATLKSKIEAYVESSD